MNTSHNYGVASLKKRGQFSPFTHSDASLRIFMQGCFDSDQRADTRPLVCPMGNTVIYPEI